MGGGVSLPQAPPEFGSEYKVPFSAEDAPHYVSLVTEERPIRYAPKGSASEEKTPATTLAAIARAVIKQTQGRKDLIAVRVERPCPPLDPVTKKAPPAMAPADLTTWTYAEYLTMAMNVAGGLVTLGFREHDIACIYGFNAPEWNMAALAGIMAHGAFTGIYPSDTAQQIQWKTSLTNASVAFVDTGAAAATFFKLANELPYLKCVVHWGDDFDKNSKSFVRDDGSEIKFISWKDAVELGSAPETQAKVQERIDAIKPSDCCDLIFTSGTTGRSKAVMLSHDNIIFNCRGVNEMLTPYIGEKEKQRTLSYLPLSHVAGAIIDIFCPLLAVHDFGALGFTWETTVARPYDLKAGSLKDRLVLTRPTLFLGVPRVWEKIHERMLEIGSKVKGAKRKVADWAKGKALTRAEHAQVGGNGKVPVGFGAAAGLLGKIKVALGLDCCRIGFSGAAPLKMATLRYFASINININELYGMSECTGTTTMSTPSTHVWGSVGFALPGVEVKIFKPSEGADPQSEGALSECPRTGDLFRPKPDEEGEICFRGRHIMLGYMANPALGEDHVREIRLKNAETIDKHGWLHSGDKGCIDKDGMVRVTGRYKELIIGAGGENIAPVPIEDAILEACKAISNVIMIGDKRKFNVALVTLKAEGATGELPGGDDLADSALGIVDGVTKVSQALASQEFADHILRAIAAVNKNGDVVPSNAAKIQKFTILPRDFSISTGELTATLKLKRSVVEDMYSTAINALYASSETYVRFQAPELA